MNHDEAMRTIARGGKVSGLNRNLWGETFPEPVRYFGSYLGYLPRGLRDNLDKLAQENGGYEGVVYSYTTPIAVKIAGVWIAPDITYSTTTSSHHQGRLYMLGAEWCPWDAGVEELRSILAGDIWYDRYKKRYRKG